MKINFITATMAGGGTERVIATLANYFITKGYHVEIVMLAESTIAYELDKSISVIQLTEKTHGNILARINRIYLLRRYFKKNRGSVCFSFGTESNMFSIIASIMLKLNLIVSERNDPNKCEFSKLRNFLYYFPSKFVFQTNDAKEYFGEKIGRRSVVIPNPLSISIPQQYLGERSKTIVAVGRLESQKNHKLLISAFSEFYKMFSDYRLIIFGEGDLEQELKLQVQKLNITDKVVFAGFSKTVLEDIKDATMYILSSNYEGISNSLLEAMAIGIPVISTDCPIGGSRMLIQHGINGLLVSIGKQDEMLQAMKKIATDREYAAYLSRNAVNVREKYGIEYICEQWESLLAK